jgi:hypothetical protein
LHDTTSTRKTLAHRAAEVKTARSRRIIRLYGIDYFSSNIKPGRSWDGRAAAERLPHTAEL